MTETPHCLLELRPLLRDDDLTANLVQGVKHTLRAVFADAFAVRDVVIALREVTDNILTHADWDGPTQPTLKLWYQGGRFTVFSENTPSDPVRATRRAEEILKRSLAEQGEEELLALLTREDVVGGSPPSAPPGGIGLMQLVTSPRCRVYTKVRDGKFTVEINVRVPELGD